MGLAGLKQGLWRGIATAYHLSGAARARNRGCAAILTYHRILSSDDLRSQFVQPGMYVGVEAFRMQMDYLRRESCVISFAELLRRWSEGDWDAGVPYCVITFDDGWLDNYREAFPVLRGHGLPATIFLPTDFIGTARWFWPERLGLLLKSAEAWGNQRQDREAVHAALRVGLQAGWPERATRPFPSTISAAAADDVIDACKQLEAGYLEDLLASLASRFSIDMPTGRTVVDWEEVREMSRQGISFGSHSCSHRLLDRLTNEECRAEAVLSLEQLRTNGAAVAPVFCYPNGNYSVVAQGMVREAGYEAAVSCRPGLETSQPSDLFGLKRISLHQDISATPSLFAMALAGLR